MNDAPPPLPPTEEPNSGSVPGMALLGFLAYAAVGWLTLVLRGNPLLFALFLCATIYLALKRLWRGFALGVLIGLGVTLLLVGACFAVFAMK